MSASDGPGFFYELFALAGAVVGYLVAAWEYPRLAAWYMRYVNSTWAADIAGFLTIFLVVCAAGRRCRTNRSMGRHGVGLRWFDRVLGGLFGVTSRPRSVHRRRHGVGVVQPHVAYLQESRDRALSAGDGSGLIWAAPAELRAAFSAMAGICCAQFRSMWKAPRDVNKT